MALDLLAPFSRGAPAIPASECQAGPSLQAQSADVAIRVADWVLMDNVIWGVVLVGAVVAVLVIYRTQLMGSAFASRWWKGWALTALMLALIALGIALLWPANTFGCQFGDAPTHVPILPAIGRALLAGLWSFAWVMIISVVLTRVSRRIALEPFAKNSRTPF